MTRRPGMLRSLRRLALTGTLALVWACANRGGVEPSAPAAMTAPVRTDDPLQRAIADYHERGDLDGLKRWLQGHFDHPEAALWREVVALRAYDDAIAHAIDRAPDEEAPRISPEDLREIAMHHPATLAGEMADAALGRAVLHALREPVLNPRVLDFLEGGTDWARDAQGRPLSPDLDAQAFAERHASSVARRIGDHLVAVGCTDAVGWCLWWVRRFPAAEQTPTLESDLRQVWYDRAHPPWKSGRHQRCAYACTRKCREVTTALDDACYPDCFARC